MKSILDRSFRYTPSTSTDLRKTFAVYGVNSALKNRRAMLSRRR